MKNDVDENGFIIEPEEKEQDYEGSYFIVLTSVILKDKRINDFQKILFATISGLCRERGYCWATNAYLEKKLNKSETQISNGISKLVEEGYLEREIVFKNMIDKSNKKVITKQVSFRKLSININTNQTEALTENRHRGMPEFRHRGMPENHNLINNNIINNISNNSFQELIGEDEMIDEDDIGVKVIEETTPKKAPAEKKKSKGGGLAPLIDLVETKYPKDKYLELNKILIEYLKAHIGRRRLPTPVTWEGRLEKLKNYSSISLSGTEGVKLNQGVAHQIVEKALKGKDGIPFLEFDDIYGYDKKNVMEPQFNLNQKIVKGY